MTEPSKEMVEAAARGLAYDNWPHATHEERKAWEEENWSNYISKAENALVAALASRSPALAEYNFTASQLADYVDKCRAAWEASRAAPASAEQKTLQDAADIINKLTDVSPAPAGEWQWVPKEPTDEMVRAAYKDQPGAINCGFAQSYRAMLSASPSPPADEWQSIETAPKDGTRFIAYDRRTGNIGVAYRHDPGGIARNPKHHYETWVWELACDTEPTHWRPLPSPPAIKSGEHKLCEDCPPVGYSTDRTRCLPCPRRELVTTPHSTENT